MIAKKRCDKKTEYAIRNIASKASDHRLITGFAFFFFSYKSARLATIFLQRNKRAP